MSKSGSVKVEKLMEIERYSHVMHISSTVTGQSAAQAYYMRATTANKQYFRLIYAACDGMQATAAVM